MPRMLCVCVCVFVRVFASALCRESESGRKSNPLSSPQHACIERERISGEIDRNIKERIASELARKVWITRNREKIEKKSGWDQDEGQEEDLEDNQRIRI